MCQSIGRKKKKNKKRRERELGNKRTKRAGERRKKEPEETELRARLVEVDGNGFSGLGLQEMGKDKQV